MYEFYCASMNVKMTGYQPCKLHSRIGSMGGNSLTVAFRTFGLQILHQILRTKTKNKTQNMNVQRYQLFKIETREQQQNFDNALGKVLAILRDMCQE